MATTVEAGISWGDFIDPWIQNRLLTVKGPDDNLDQDILRAHASGKCSLYNLYEDQVRQGFCIVRSEDTLRGKTLHIWVLYHEGQVDPMEAHSDFFDNMARSIGATSITFSANRLGWLRKAPKYNFRLREIIFSREVK